MGAHGHMTRRLVEEGLLQPDLIAGMTLALIARQPRSPHTDSKQASGVAGGVWVREQFTIHRPVAHGDAFSVTGVWLGTHVRKGRTYSTTSALSVDSTGRPFATNLTTGLVTYRSDPTLADSPPVIPPDRAIPRPDLSASAANPHLDELQALSVGQMFSCDDVLVSLEMMRARDTATPENPIHSDVDEARKAGLGRPIAGGSHVLAFAIESVMRGIGPYCLLHGACFDVRWRVPTQDDTRILPSATVTRVDDQAVALELRVELIGGPTAMIGSVVIPVAR